MISEWMDHGNINEFVEKHEGINRVQLVSDSTASCEDMFDRSIQLVDAANGLEYMHGLQMVHGDLKGVQSYWLSIAQPLITTARQTSSSTSVSTPVSPTLASRPLLVRGAMQQPMPP